MITSNHSIVLDFDECLVHTSSSPDLGFYWDIVGGTSNMQYRNRLYKLELLDVSTGSGAGQPSTYWGMTRPHLAEFLEFAFGYFENVIVWSAGTYQYVVTLAPILFRDVGRPAQVLTRNDTENSSDGDYSKPLRNVFEKVPSMTFSNTLILDDKNTNFLHNPDNGVLIPRYHPTSDLEGLQMEDLALLQFKNWLTLPEVANSKDVRLLDKSNIFIGNPTSQWKRNMRVGFGNIQPVRFGVTSAA